MLSYYLSIIDTEEGKCKFERIYLRYRGLLFAVAMKILRNEQDAEDAVQQAFLSIIENLKKLSSADCPETRSYAVRTCAIIRTAIMAQYPSFWTRRRSAAILCGLQATMAKLPPRYRTVLLLRYDNGYNTRELAEILHIKRESVNRLLWRAKEALKKAMEEGGEKL